RLLPPRRRRRQRLGRHHRLSARGWSGGGAFWILDFGFWIGRLLGFMESSLSREVPRRGGGYARPSTTSFMSLEKAWCKAARPPVASRLSPGRGLTSASERISKQFLNPKRAAERGYAGRVSCLSFRV